VINYDQFHYNASIQSEDTKLNARTDTQTHGRRPDNPKHNTVGEAQKWQHNI